MWHTVGNDQSCKVQNINLLSSYFDQMSPCHSAIYNGPKFSVNRQPPVRGEGGMGGMSASKADGQTAD